MRWFKAILINLMMFLWKWLKKEKIYEKSQKKTDVAITLKSEHWELSKDFTNYHSYIVLYV